MIEKQNNVNTSDLANCRLRSPGKPMAFLLVVTVIGLIAATVNGLFVDDALRRFMQGYLVAFAFVLSISLGSLFFVLMQHLMRAGWSVVVRRIAEIFCLNILTVGLLFLPIAWSVWQADGLIYEWSKTNHAPSETNSHLTDGPVAAEPIHPVSSALPGTSEYAEGTHEESLHATDKPFLNSTRFLVSWIVLFAIWIAIAVFYYRCSVAQDKSANVELTRKMEWWSGIATLLFAFSLTWAAFDLLMSLDPLWYSTIFGVYYFAGCAVAGMATMLLVVLVLRQTKQVPFVFNEEVQRDLGRLAFAFVFFWAYIGFSQYMLLWYANMPETTGWLVKRGMSTATGYANSWGWLAILLLFAHFMIPFCGIMSRHVKSSAKWMMFWCGWLLVIHYLDLYWIVIPQSNAGLTISLIEVGAAAAVVGVYGMAAIWIASRANWIPIGDPRMHESMTRHAAY